MGVQKSGSASLRALGLAVGSMLLGPVAAVPFGRMGQEHASQDMLADSIGAKLSAALGWDKILPSAMDPADFASGDAVQAILLGDGSSSNPDSSLVHGISWSEKDRVVGNMDISIFCSTTLVFIDVIVVGVVVCTAVFAFKTLWGAKKKAFAKARDISKDVVCDGE